VDIVTYKYPRGKARALPNYDERHYTPFILTFQLFICIFIAFFGRFVHFLTQKTDGQIFEVRLFGSEFDVCAAVYI
jgi:hypothetical protein